MQIVCIFGCCRTTLCVFASLATILRTYIVFLVLYFFNTKYAWNTDGDNEKWCRFYNILGQSDISNNVQHWTRCGSAALSLSLSRISHNMIHFSFVFTNNFERIFYYIFFHCVRRCCLSYSYMMVKQESCMPARRTINPNHHRFNAKHPRFCISNTRNSSLVHVY